MKKSDQSRLDLTSDCTACSPKPGQNREGDLEFFARRPGRSFRVRLISQTDLQIVSQAGFYYNVPLSGMCRVVLVRQVYTGVFLYAMIQVIDGADPDLPENICRQMYMAAATSFAIKLGDDIEEIAQAIEQAQDYSGVLH